MHLVASLPNWAWYQQSVAATEAVGGAEEFPDFCCWESQCLRSASSEWREAIVSTFALTGEMALKGAGRGASGVTAMRLSAREVSCSVPLLG